MKIKRFEGDVTEEDRERWEGVPLVHVTGAGDRIRRARTELHLSQEYVARYLGISRSDVAGIESDRRPVSAGELGKLGELFLIPEEILIEGTGTRMPVSLPSDQLGEADRREILNLVEFKWRFAGQFG